MNLPVLPSRPECTLCLLHEHASHPGVPTVPHPETPVREGRPFILFVGQNPGWNEDQQNEPFIGSSGQSLRNNYIGGISLTLYPFTIYFTNAVRCYTVNNETPRITPISKCRAHLVDDLKALLSFHRGNCDSVVVALGAIAVKSMSGLFPDIPATLTKAFAKQGLRVETPAGSFRFFATFHPQAVAYNRNLAEAVGDHMQLIQDYAATHTVPTPSAPTLVKPRSPLIRSDTHARPDPRQIP